jgi:MoaA/NifB/PqqE/SkfB family radical SAM enzyme
MFKFDELKQIHLEITNNCQAACPMCSRNYHGGLTNPLIKIQEWSYEDFVKIINYEVLNQVDSIYFCGNFGDPLLNDNLIDMCDYVSSNSSVSIRIHTNGSLRNVSWWKKLAESLPEDHLVIFGIDGLEDTHFRYRIGTSYNKIIENASAFISAGGKAEWAFIVFQHNQHQVEQARSEALKLGFKRFTVKHSSRFLGENVFPVYDKQGTIVDELKPSTETVIKFIDKTSLANYQKIVDETEIDCQAIKSKEVYIDAYKNLMPCCFLGLIPYSYNPTDSIVFDIKQQISTQYQNLLLDLKNTNTLELSVKEIIDSTEYQTVWTKYWSTEKLITCVRTCGKNKFSKPVDQFVEKEILNG